MNSAYPRWKRVMWMVLGGVVLFWIGKSLLPELILAGKDGVAIVRVEGPILDSYQTVEELKTFAEDPLVKAIVVNRCSIRRLLHCRGYRPYSGQSRDLDG
ncbi:MAG: hypothetical protein P8X46_07140 [Nitrospirales bacterium]